MQTGKIFIVLTVLAIGIITTAWADMSENDYRTVAENFLLYQHSSKKIISADAIKDGERIIGYVMRLENGGYILIPATKLLSPVKAYSLGNCFDNLPPGYKAFLTGELKSVQDAQIARRNSEPSETYSQWDFLLSYKQRQNIPRDSSSKTLNLTTKWDQGFPYNKKMPMIGSENASAGCVQTLLAQVMKYYKSPLKGRGIVTQTWNGQTLKAILNRNYNWDIMPDVLDSYTPEYQQDEVASLMRDLAIMNQADYSIDGTSSSTSDSLLKMSRYFGYSLNVKEMSNSDVSFFYTIKSEIDSGRLVLLALKDTATGVRHSAVGFGYISDSTGDKVNLNMGWGGDWDNFYYYNKAFYADSSYYTIIDLYYNVKPCSTGVDCYENSLESTDSKTVVGNTWTLSGQFNSQYDLDSYYPIACNGSTTIKGRRPSGAQSFDIMIYNSNFELVKFIEGSSANPSLTTTINLNPDNYYIETTLSGWTYYTSGGNPYTVTISTNPGGGATVGLSDVIQILRILSGITTTYQGQDVNSDGKIGLQEAIYILQKVSGLR